MKKGSYFKPFDNNHIQCQLCPHQCILANGEKGKCKVRSNLNGTLNAENYGILSSISLDPVEKKPLYHFYPGAKVLSIGSLGCNLDCFFCQNCDISQASVEDFPNAQKVDVETMVERAKASKDNIGMAYTYNEPTVFYEYMFDLAHAVKQAGMLNVVVSNGYINPIPLKELIPLIDAFNIDLKGFTDQFYKKASNAHLRPVKDSLATIRDSGCHLEVTNLIVPGWNDDLKHFKSMLKWISNELGRETVLHLSRYFPAYKATMPKTSPTLLFRFYEEACKQLDYVYLGNIAGSESQNTICNQCGKIAISRYNNFVQRNGMNDSGHCIHCNHKIVVC
jgi:pyruvate formate lyase activating enzyme